MSDQEEVEEFSHPKKHSVERDNTSSIVNATTLSQTFTNLTDGVKNLKNHRNFRIKIPLVKEKYDKECKAILHGEEYDIIKNNKNNIILFKNKDKNKEYQARKKQILIPSENIINSIHSTQNNIHPISKKNDYFMNPQISFQSNKSVRSESMFTIKIPINPNNKLPNYINESEMNEPSINLNNNYILKNDSNESRSIYSSNGQNIYDKRITNSLFHNNNNTIAPSNMSPLNSPGDTTNVFLFNDTNTINNFKNYNSLDYDFTTDIFRSNNSNGET